MAWTKEYRAEYMRKYYQEHKEKIRQNINAWNKRNPEKVAESRKKQYQKHKDDPKYKKQCAEAQRRWYLKNRDRLLAYHRERYLQKIIREINEGKNEQRKAD